MEDSQDKELRDYKFDCFDGKVHALLLVTNRHGKGKMYFDYFDSEFSHFDLLIIGIQTHRLRPANLIRLIQMIELAENIVNRDSAC